MSLIARRIDFWNGREGHLFGGAMRMTPCDSNDQAAPKVLYALTNTVKDGLTPTVEHSPLFNTYAFQALGKEQRYFDFRRSHAAGGKSKQKLRFKDFMEWKTLQIAPLPDEPRPRCSHVSQRNFLSLAFFWSWVLGASCSCTG